VKSRLARIATYTSLAVVAVFVLLVGFGYWLEIPKYTTKTIPIWAYSWGVQGYRIWWIDNDRVIFTGADPTRVVPSSYPGVPFELFAIYIWDTRKNELRRYAELNTSGRLVCFERERGTIKYYVRGPNDRTVSRQVSVGFQGVLGEEPQPWNPRTPEDDGVKRGWWRSALFGCRSQWEADYARPEHVMRGGTTWPLWPEDGYLYSRTRMHATDYESAMDSRIELWRPNAEVGAILPITAKEILNSSVYYSDYKTVYIVPAGVRKEETRSSIGGFQPGRKRPVYFVSRFGEVDTVWFPDDDWIAGGMGFLPTVAGYLVASNFTRRAQSRDAGVWIVKNGSSYKLIDHLVDEFSVSPDGCKAVVSIANPDKKPQFSRSMSVFEFCDQGVQQ